MAIRSKLRFCQMKTILLALEMIIRKIDNLKCVEQHIKDLFSSKNSVDLTIQAFKGDTSKMARLVVWNRVFSPRIDHNRDNCRDNESNQ